MSSSSSLLMMIRPMHFAFNAQTAATNTFQKPMTEEDLLLKVQSEFDAAVEQLRYYGVDVLVFNDRKDVVTPDSVFPNNWISVTGNTIVLYPMLAENRRMERNPAIVDALKTRLNIEQIIDFTSYEKDNLFLEGTGSLVTDKINHIAYAALSPRTSVSLVEHWCATFGYRPVIFNTLPVNGIPVYHTNVILTIGTGYAILGSGMIANNADVSLLKQSLTGTGHQIIEITNEQVTNFAGNMLEVSCSNNKKLLLVSSTAYKSLSLAQVEHLKQFAELLVIPVSTIEQAGGGSIRCMIAELIN